MCQSLSGIESGRIPLRPSSAVQHLLCDGGLVEACVTTLLDVAPTLTRDGHVYDVLKMAYMLLHLYCINSAFRRFSLFCSSCCVCSFRFHVQCFSLSLSRYYQPPP